MTIREETRPAARRRGFRNGQERLCNCILQPQEPPGARTLVLSAMVGAQEIKFEVRLDCLLHGGAARAMTRAALRQPQP